MSGNPAVASVANAPLRMLSGTPPPAPERPTGDANSPEDTLVTMHKILVPSQTNAFSISLLGGELLKWMDTCACLACASVHVELSDFCGLFGVCVCGKLNAKTETGKKIKKIIIIIKINKNNNKKIKKKN